MVFLARALAPAKTEQAQIVPDTEASWLAYLELLRRELANPDYASQAGGCGLTH
jgi:hypothetical protein